MTEENKNPFNSEEWQKVSQAFQEAIEHERNLSETFWKNLSSEEQLWVFCAIMRRLHDGYLKDGSRSYRGILYDVMKWGPEAYAPAQCSGFLDIHNSIYDLEELTKTVVGVAQELGHQLDPKAVEDALIKKKYF